MLILLTLFDVGAALNFNEIFGLKILFNDLGITSSIPNTLKRGNDLKTALLKSSPFSLIGWRESLITWLISGNMVVKTLIERNESILYCAYVSSFKIL